MENDACVDQSGLLFAKLLGAEAVPLQKAWTLVGEEYVGILQQAIELGAIFFGVIQYCGTHSDLYVPSKGLQLRVIRAPDVEHIGAVESEVSADGRPGNHMAHS